MSAEASSSKTGEVASGKKRRSNAGKACRNCRRRKSRCDGTPPTCNTCRIYSDECVWGDEEDGRKPASRQYVAALKSRIKVLESALEASGHGIASTPEIAGEEEEGEDGNIDEQDVEGMAQTMLHLHMSEAGEEVHYHGPTSAYAHSTHAPVLGSSPNDTAKEGLMNRPHDFRRYLPTTVVISHAEHTVVLDRFFRFFASWGMRAFPDLFHQDMVRTVMLPPNTPPARFTHYSPFLHNMILALALKWSDNEDLQRFAIRDIFASQADRYLQAELARPTLATVQGLALKSSYHSTTGDHTGGWIYFGMSDRAALSLGLNVDCAPLVESGKMSQSELLMRRNTFWTIYIQEQCWSVYIGRPHVGQDYNTPIPTIDKKLDDMPWQWDNTVGEERHLPPQPCMFSSTFVETAKLCVLMQKVMTTMYSLKSDVVRLQKDSVISELGLALDSWSEQLPPGLLLSGHSNKNALPHIIMLQLAKEWLTILIYRPYYRPIITNAANKSAESSEGIFALAVRRCDRSAGRINSLLRTYNARFGLQFTPPTLFNIVFTAGTTHLLSAVRHRSTRIKEDALSGANECVQALRTVSQSWPAAGHKAEILEELVREYDPAYMAKPSPGFGRSNSIGNSPLETLTEVKPDPASSSMGSAPIAIPSYHYDSIPPQQAYEPATWFDTSSGFDGGNAVHASMGTSQGSFNPIESPSLQYYQQQHSLADSFIAAPTANQIPNTLTNPATESWAGGSIPRSTAFGESPQSQRPMQMSDLSSDPFLQSLLAHISLPPIHAPPMPAPVDPLSQYQSQGGDTAWMRQISGFPPLASSSNAPGNYSESAQAQLARTLLSQVRSESGQGNELHRVPQQSPFETRNFDGFFGSGA